MSERTNACLQEYPNAETLLVPCGTDVWACDSGACRNGNFSIPRGAISHRADQMALRPTYSACSGSGSSTSGPRYQVSTTTVISTLGASTVTTVSIQQAPTTVTSSTCSVDAASAQIKSPATSVKLGVVGIGTGVPLALALLAAVAMFIRERRRNRVLTDQRHCLRWEVDRHKMKAQQQVLWIANPNTAAFELSAAGDAVELSPNIAKYRGID